MRRPRERHPHTILGAPPRKIHIGKGSVVHHSSIVGFPNRHQDIFTSNAQRIVRIGERCTIYPWCLIYEGANISDDVERGLQSDRVLRLDGRVSSSTARKSTTTLASGIGALSAVLLPTTQRLAQEAVFLVL